MEIIFLDKETLKYKDHAYIDKDFDLIVDMVVPQKSNFTLNKEKVNATSNDLFVLKTKNQDYFYIGIIDTIQANNNKTTKIQSYDVSQIFNVELPIKSFTGNLSEWLKQLIESTFISNPDMMQNKQYLKVTINTNIYGSIDFDEDSISNLSKVIQELNKRYNLLLRYKIEIDNFTFSKINIVVDEVEEKIKIKSNLNAISELLISENSKKTINKLTYYPKKDNEVHKEILTFYLLTNGNITKEMNNPNRYREVIFKSVTYSDNDYEKLEENAKAELSVSEFEHSITFKLYMENSVIIPFKNVFVGDYIKFIKESKTYNSVVSQLRFNGDFTTCNVTLGEYRTTLTDKIKLIEQQIGSGGQTQKVSTTTNIDGGTF